MLEKNYYFMRGPAAWKFLFRLVVAKNTVDLGLQTARFVAEQVLHDPTATVRHGHGGEGCDIEGSQGAREVKLKLHLISNQNRIVDTNVANYIRRKGPDRGLFVTTPIILIGGELSENKAPGKKLNIPLEVIILVVTMTHETGEKPLVTAGDIIATAKQALAKEFPGRAYEEMNREELVAMLQVQGMQALNAEIEVLETRAVAQAQGMQALHKKIEALESRVNDQGGNLTRELGEIKGLLERLLKKK